MASTTPSRFVTTGAPSPWPNDDPPPKRLNIVDFVKNEKMFSLYVQAIQEMYQTGNDVVTSYYQVGGIHGLPYVPWNNDPRQESASPKWEGYCTHKSPLFPTWHRPYVATFEQILQDHATTIAKEYTTEIADWLQAAAELRQPFWDWAAPGQAVPPDEVIRLTKVFIRAKPDGKRTEVENPLFTYMFKSPVPGAPSCPPFDKWPTTLRHPKNDQSDPDALVQDLSANQAAWTNDTFFMFIFLKTWPEFSNTREHTLLFPAKSLEAIHNDVHDFTGGGGHMSDPSMAGFDPIFYMHHANVDRLLSLWAALHPGVWVTKDKEVDGTFDIPENTDIDEHTGLSPFLDSQNTYWTSNSSTDTTRLGYMYPEFEGLDMSDPTAVRQAISRIIRKLYWPSFLSFTGSATTTTMTTGPDIPDSIPDPVTAWSARVRVKPSELERSFQVLVFLGSIPEDSNNWISAPSYVGSFSAFVNGAAELCANCQDQLDVITEGYVHLESVIIRDGPGYPLDPKDVVDYLAQNLDWRVQMADGTPVLLDRLPSLEVTVVSQKIQLSMPQAPFPGPRMPLPYDLPVAVGEPILYPDIVSGRTL